MGWSVRMNEDVYGVTELRESLPQVVDKANSTKRPMIITRHSRAVAAIVDIDELQRLYDRIEELEEMESRQVVEAFRAAEERGEIEWVSNEEMAKFVDDLITRARKRA